MPFCALRVSPFVAAIVSAAVVARADSGLLGDPEPLTLPSSTVSPRAGFLLSNERLHDDPEVLFPGFLNGLRGFEHFHEPIGQSLFFESPLITTNVRFLYLHQNFPEHSQLQGGDLSVFGAQARLALTERLAFLAWKDGFSFLNAGILPDDESFNDIGVGLKYAVIVDRENDFLLTPGVRWEWSNGSDKVLQGGPEEFSFFATFAKGFDRFHLIGDVNYRIPDDGNDGNQIFSWDLHADYEISPSGLPGFAPVIELHGLHYLTNGNRFPLHVGGLDYDNLGSSDVAGSTVIWAGFGARWRLTPHASLGATYDVPLTNRNADILEDRITIDLTITW